MKRQTDNSNRKAASSSSWIRPLIFLFSLSFSLFLFSRLVDFLFYNYTHHAADSKYSIDILGLLYNSDIGNLTNTLGGLGELVTSVLGIEITVIAIIVQLAANKYSSGIMELFVENPVNVTVIGLYIITAINSLLISNTLSQPYIPVFSITLMFVMIIISLLLILPHFAYVFNFLRPENFLGYVRDRINTRLQGIAGNAAMKIEEKEQIVADINFLGDIALNSVAQSDRAVPLLCITYLREMISTYSVLKPEMPDVWFRMTGKEYLDPDFSSYSRFVIETIEKKKIFIERKVFRLYEMLFNNARSSLRDVASGVLLNSQLIAVEAVKSGNKETLHCASQFFNSYLRIAIREKDPRSAFNALEHYRIVAENLLDYDPQEVEALSFYFKYYGQEASKNQVLFILETAAHDLCAVNELAFEKNVFNLEELLHLFLTLDEPLDETVDKGSSTKEMSLIGVRIAQAKLASFYLLKNRTDLARVIYEDMKIEPRHRIHKIREIISSIKQEEFWEITPRGINFNYLSEERRVALEKFFDWFSNKPM
ncbi:MAG: DUF2254 domain-containing protein [Ignavibacteriales bacterium]|nr:DUF2254 domain-containing protein [Ignavibacteriales bacterium]